MLPQCPALPVYPPSVCLSPLLTVSSVRTGTLLPWCRLEYVSNKHILEKRDRERERKRKEERRTYASLQAVEGAARKEFSSIFVPLLTLSPQPATAPPQWLTVVQRGPSGPFGEARVGEHLHLHRRCVCGWGWGVPVQPICLINVVTHKILGAFGKDPPSKKGQG